MDWSRDCRRLLAAKIAGPEARAARERPPLRGLENVRSSSFPAAMPPNRRVAAL